MNNSHKWEDVELQGYQALHCDKCHYSVVAYPDPEFIKEVGAGGNMHLPEHQVILVGKTNVTREEAFRLTEVYGVECKVG